MKVKRRFPAAHRFVREIYPALSFPERIVVEKVGIDERYLHTRGRGEKDPTRSGCSSASSMPSSCTT